MSSTIDHHVPSLNSSLNGTVEEGIACFRGIPYATVDKRWTHSQTRHSLQSPFDATNYGPRCSQVEGQVLVTGGVNDPIPGDDEFKCLNLNVAVPKEALKAGSNLPVMVWIHGGAFLYGANSVARYRPVELSLLAQRQGNPVIIVQIQYRLGALGFAASSDILSENPSLRSKSNPDVRDPNSTFGNFGLVDQINALEWVRDHIREFGGNSANVTAFGVSAGSASIHHHILTGNPLFDRAILMSGCAPTLGPLPVEMYEQAWQNLLARKGGFETPKTPQDRLEKARALSPMEVIQNYTSAPMGTMADGVLLPKGWRYNEKQQPTRCKEIIIGDTKVEAIIMDGLIKRLTPDQFIPLVQASMKDSNGFLNAFGIKHGMEPQAYLDAMRSFLSVGMFQYPNIIVANSFPGKVFYYHFDEPSPYPGPTHGLPYHGQCALFVYQNGVSEYPDAARATAEEMGRLWIAFASGSFVPWEEYEVASRFMRLGPEGKAAMQSQESDDVRDYKWLEWVVGSYESLRQFTQDITCKV